jgi:acetyl esterase/lipase
MYTQIVLQFVAGELRYIRNHYYCLHKSSPMRKHFIYFVAALSIGFSSCTKDDLPNMDPIAAKIMLNEAYGTDPRQTMDIYLPPNRNSRDTKVMVLIHGGGWSGGDKSDMTVIVDSMKKRLPDYAFFNINYRLASWPANLFPTQEIDVKAAVAFIHGNSDYYQVSKKFVFAGASAGGHLALLQGFKDSVPVKARAIVSFFGPSDMVDMYNNPASPAAPAAAIAALMSGTPTSNPGLYFSSSPINYINSSSAPTILIQGGLDPLVRPSQSTSVQTKLTAAGVANQLVFYPTGGHGDWDVATYTDAFNKIQAFLAAKVQ